MNSIAVKYPTIVKFWHPVLNGELTPDSVSFGSNKKVWWLGECGHEWDEPAHKRNSATSLCPVCINKRLAVGVNDVATLYPELVALWHPTKNGTLTLSDFVPGTAKKGWFLCNKGHTWMTEIRAIVKGSRACLYCSGQKCLTGFNDLETMNPDMALEWHPTKNGNKLPSEIHYGSGYKVWWQCNSGHEWLAVVHDRKVNKIGCPFCSGRNVIPGVNSLAETNPKLASQWHPTKNGDLTPNDVKQVSHHRVWWLCEKGHEWEAVIGNRSGNGGRGCAKCSSAGTSRGEQALAEVVRGLVGVENVVCNTRKVLDNVFELDIFVPGKMIAVEFNGLYWHSEARGKGRFYHYDKWLACKEKGIQLIQIWEDDWVRSPVLVTNMLAHKLGVAVESKVFARKTRVKVIGQGEADTFLNGNHIQGTVHGGIRLGLMVIDPASGELNSVPLERLVAVMLLKNEAGSEGKTLNLLRFATSQPVVGGFTKLLKYAERIVGVERVVTFSDNTVSDGGLYASNGFVADKELKPDYMYVVDKVERKHKFGFRLKKFRDDPGLQYVDGLTERELAELNGLDRIWDAGKIRWVKTVS